MTTPHPLTRWLLFVGMVCILSSLSGARAAAAQGTPSATPTPVPPPPSFIIQPTAGEESEGFLSIELAPGERGDLSVLLGKARGADEEAALVYKADVVTLPNGGLGVLDADSVATGPTTWLEFESATFTWEEGEGVEQTFGVTVPEGTP